ncbi:hypothetical protein GCM10010446_34590 [Streptomyces enissocaesilis]|uniref:Uncharacterized protein n=1 Tax=Streptomyces enissocaesilis TaxID=332589 RepID=A0ABP6JT86_9ACTN
MTGPSSRSATHRVEVRLDLGDALVERGVARAPAVLLGVEEVRTDATGDVAVAKKHRYVEDGPAGVEGEIRGCLWITCPQLVVPEGHDVPLEDSQVIASQYLQPVLVEFGPMPLDDLLEDLCGYLEVPGHIVCAQVNPVREHDKRLDLVEDVDAPQVLVAHRARFEQGDF